MKKTVKKIYDLTNKYDVSVHFFEEINPNRLLCLWYQGSIMRMDLDPYILFVNTTGKIKVNGYLKNKSCAFNNTCIYGIHLYDIIGDYISTDKELLAAIKNQNPNCCIEFNSKNKLEYLVINKRTHEEKVYECKFLNVIKACEYAIYILDKELDNSRRYRV